MDLSSFDIVMRAKRINVSINSQPRDTLIILRGIEFRRTRCGCCANGTANTGIKVSVDSSKRNGWKPPAGVVGDIYIAIQASGIDPPTELEALLAAENC